ncbi:MAG: hypothetical protein DMF97_05130 [Acidobacteria bacterium]|nr:MAG: hypothetical protein DMF97_05130 [Acidobacteriota bacterium]PYR23454.1 MAG: hypothetical protein DMF98_18400 [Acidobacteriota bacterium]
MPDGQSAVSLPASAVTGDSASNPNANTITGHAGPIHLHLDPAATAGCRSGLRCSISSIRAQPPDSLRFERQLSDQLFLDASVPHAGETVEKRPNSLETCVDFFSR